MDLKSIKNISGWKFSIYATLQQSSKVFKCSKVSPLHSCSRRLQRQWSLVESQGEHRCICKLPKGSNLQNWAWYIAFRFVSGIISVLHWICLPVKCNKPLETKEWDQHRTGLDRCPAAKISIRKSRKTHHGPPLDGEESCVLFPGNNWVNNTPASTHSCNLPFSPSSLLTTLLKLDVFEAPPLFKHLFYLVLVWLVFFWHQ